MKIVPFGSTEQEADPASAGLAHAWNQSRPNALANLKARQRGKRMSTARTGLAEVPADLSAATEATLLRTPLQTLAATPNSQVLDLLPAAVYVTDAGGHITYFNAAAAELWGYRPRLNADRWCGSWRLYWPDGTPMRHDQCPTAIALKEKRAVRGSEAIAERPDGTRVPFLAFPTPLYDAAGKVAGAVNMLVDVSEHRRAERIERRLASIVESSDDAIISKDLNGVIATFNKGAQRLFGYLAEEVIGKPVTILIPSDRQDEETGILERIRRGERVEHFETVRRCKDGNLVSVSLTVSPVTDEGGKIIGASKIARDITEQKRREEQITLLAREADHRTKNLLALAQATVHLTQAETPGELKKAIDGRLQALAKAHTLLAQSRWAGADLRGLVIGELSPYLGNGDARAEVEGPNLMLDPDPAQAIAMALHELTTNAVKYGALSTPQGRVRVDWGHSHGRLVFCWAESGGPAVSPPRRNGFGTRVMQRMICSQCSGEIDFNWREEGVVCEITLTT
jgi:two-component system CheB/CheR fusion protein